MNTNQEPSSALVSSDLLGLSVPPDDWTCNECGTASWKSAIVIFRREMLPEERVSLDQYGPDEGIFCDSDEIVICGCCHHSRWERPNNPGQPRAKPVVL